MQINRHRVTIVAILSFFFINNLAYHFATPPFEAPDAYYHFAVIQYIDETGQLPPKDNPADSAWQQMTYHAPLYYYLSSFLLEPINTHDFLHNYPRNPHAQIGEPSATDNYNFVAHVNYPWRDTELAIHVIRLFSAVLGILTLLGIYIIARQIIPTDPQVALLAMFVVAVIPQFVYMSAMISNDNLVITLSTWGLAVLFWMLNTDLNWQRMLILSIILASNSLAKASGFAVYPVVIVALSGYGWQKRWPLRKWLLYGGLGLVSWLLIAGWWYYDNWQTLGDPFATSAIADATGKRTGSVDYIGELRGLYFSFWGLFGWFNILAPKSFYWWTVLLLGVSGGGIVFHIKRKAFNSKQVFLVGLLFLHAILVIGTWTRFNLLVGAGQGRLWFPLLASVGLFIAYGLNQWRNIWLRTIPLGGMALATIVFPFLLISPKFEPPKQIPIDTWTIPAESTPIAMREHWQEDSCLMLWVTDPAQIQSDHKLDVSMLAETKCPIEGFWSFFVHIIDLDQQICGDKDHTGIMYQIDTMPAGGNLPLPAFEVNHVVEDNNYTIDLRSLTFDPDGHYALEFGFYDAGGSFTRMLIDDNEIASEFIEIGQCGHDTISIPLFIIK